MSASDGKFKLLSSERAGPEVSMMKPAEELGRVVLALVLALVLAVVLVLSLSQAMTVGVAFPEEAD